MPHLANKAVNMLRIQQGLVLFTVASCVTGCAFIPEPRKASEGASLALSSVQLSDPAEDMSPALELARQAVSRALNKKGVNVAADSPFELDVTLSTRPPEMGLFSRPKDGEQLGNSSVAGAVRKQRLDLCKDQVIRLSVSLVSVNSGQQLYRAHAEDQTCRALGKALITTLADEAMAGLKLSY